MKNWNAIIGAAVIAALPSLADAGVHPPEVPAAIEVPAGHQAYLEGHALGTQNYVCLPSASGGFAYSLFTPQATLFNHHDREITTHFFGPNPAENGVIRAAWQHSRDTSTVWGAAIASSTDPDFVKPGAIPWLLVQKTGVQDGPTGGDALSITTFIQRVNTTGGAAPGTGCAASTDVGRRQFVPYTADYVFYRAASHHLEGDALDEEN